MNRTNNINQQGGFVVPAVILIVVLAVIAGAAWFFLAKQDSGAPTIPRDPRLDTFEQKRRPNGGGRPMVVEEGATPPPSVVASGTASTTDTMASSSEETKEEDSEEEMEEEKDDTEVQGDQAKAEPVEGVYTAYASEKLANAESGDVVLFFHASWCPSCKSADSDIMKNTVPEGLTILKVDYDSETELKGKYGVTYQHTFVQVDKDGKQLKKWSGSPSLSAIEKELL